MSERKLHCWKDRGEHVEDVFGWGSEEYWDFVAFGESATCMLEKGHDGQHEWTSDDRISVTFREAPRS